MNTETPKPGKRRWRTAIKLLLGLALVAVGVAMIWVPRMNRYQVDGEIILAGPRDPIRIVRDEKGMPYIHASNLNDALFGQGFVTAQDRLFQIQLMRMQAEGRLTELAGDQARELDIKNRTIGIAQAAKKHAELLDDDSRVVFQSFVDGINAFLTHCPDDLPIEFKLAGIAPDRWEIKDSMSILYLMSWDTSANVSHELIQQMLIDKLGPERARQLAPLNINADSDGTTAMLPADQPDPMTLPLQADRRLALLAQAGRLRVGSNNWATAPSVSAGEHALLAGDPHLDPRMLPGIMYSIGFVLPENRGVGANAPGIPGYIVGRNQHVATAVTNSYGDVQDLYVETIDPDNDANYLDGGKSIAFSLTTETLKIKDANVDGGYRSEEFTIRSTRRGPVVSEVLPGLGLEPDKVVTLRWAAVEAMEPKLSLTELLTAKSIDDIDATIRSVTSIVLNFVFADSAGNIGWRVSGKLPIRTGGGTVPFAIDPHNESEDNWQGWIPFQDMPHQSNPERGWIGTANHYTVTADYPYYFTNFASPSYRYRRLKQRIAEKSGELDVDEHWSIQRDTRNLLAEAVAPVLAAALADDVTTQPLADVLKDWDFHDDQSAAGPTVFQSVYTEFARATFSDELGDELADKMLSSWYFWQERLESLVRSGDADWFDDVTTTDTVETMDEMIRRGGRAALKKLQPQLGADPKSWRWGKVHTLTWFNPLRRSGVGTHWLGTKPIPVDGSSETLYRGWYDFDDPYGVTHTAAVRMVVDFGDQDKVRAVLAGGEAARTFHPHQKDQIEAYVSGAPLHWWLSDQAIEAHTKSQLTLVPKR